MNKPNLFIIGFPKSGTSALHDMLCQHPLISGGRTKEPHLFSDDERFKTRLDENSTHSYSQIFPDANKFVLDSSTSYLISPDALNRIQKEVPHPKFVVIARDPIDRILSHYRWLETKGVKVKGLSKELKSELNKIWSFDQNIQGKFKFYWQFTQYGNQITRLINQFGVENVYFTLYEDFKANHQNTINEVADFLTIPKVQIINKQINTTGSVVALGSRFSFFSKWVPTKFRKTVKEAIWKLKRHQVSESDLLPIKPQLMQELKLLKNLGITTEKWISTQNFLKRFE